MTFQFESPGNYQAVNLALLPEHLENHIHNQGLCILHYDPCNSGNE